MKAKKYVGKQLFTLLLSVVMLLGSIIGIVPDNLVKAEAAADYTLRQSSSGVWFDDENHRVYALGSTFTITATTDYNGDPTNVVWESCPDGLSLISQNGDTITVKAVQTGVYTQYAEVYEMVLVGGVMSQVSHTFVHTFRIVEESELTGDGAADDGTADDGTADDGTAADGTTDDGTADDGTVADDATDDGTADDGTVADGTTDDGTADDGTADNGTTDVGTGENDTGSNGSSVKTSVASPQTGDNSNAVVWSVIFLLAASGMAVTVTYGRKRNYNR